MPSLSVFDHVRPTDAVYPDGVYRVVGTSDEAATLLRVADADGRRTNTGEIIAVGSDELDGFDPAENPDGNRPLGSAVASTLETLYWSGRAFGRELAAHPLPTAGAAALVLVGYVGPLPDVALGASVLVGILGLAYIGSGRL